MRVLAVGAHPDDLELLCGGTWQVCRARSPRNHGGGHQWRSRFDDAAEGRDRAVRKAEATAAAASSARIRLDGLPGRISLSREETRLALST